MGDDPLVDEIEQTRRDRRRIIVLVAIGIVVVVAAVMIVFLAKFHSAFDG